MHLTQRSSLTRKFSRQVPVGGKGRRKGSRFERCSSTRMFKFRNLLYGGLGGVDRIIFIIFIIITSPPRENSFLFPSGSPPPISPFPSPGPKSAQCAHTDREDSEAPSFHLIYHAGSESSRVGGGGVGFRICPTRLVKTQRLRKKSNQGIGIWCGIVGLELSPMLLSVAVGYMRVRVRGRVRVGFGDSLYTGKVSLQLFPCFHTNADVDGTLFLPPSLPPSLPPCAHFISCGCSDIVEIVDAEKKSRG